MGHGAVPLPGVLRGTGWVRAGSGSTVGSKHSQKRSLVSDSGNTMSPASLMHGPAELTTSPVSLRLFLRGCRLQPSPRAPVTSNHDLCNSSSLVLPHRGSRSLCRSPQPENHPGPWPLPSRTCPWCTRTCRAVKLAPKPLLLPLLPAPCPETMAGAPLSACHHSHPCSPTRQPQNGGCSGQRGSPGSPLPLPGACSGCNPVLRLVARFLSKAVQLLICIPETLRHSPGNIKTQSNLRPASPPPPLPSSVPPRPPSRWPRALVS